MLYIWLPRVKRENLHSAKEFEDACEMEEDVT